MTLDMGTLFTFTRIFIWNMEFLYGNVRPYLDLLAPRHQDSTTLVLD